jgi:hypothetical protein
MLAVITDHAARITHHQSRLFALFLLLLTFLTLFLLLMLRLFGLPGSGPLLARLSARCRGPVVTRSGGFFGSSFIFSGRRRG